MCRWECRGAGEGEGMGVNVGRVRWGCVWVWVLFIFGGGDRGSVVAPDGRESYVTDDVSVFKCRAPDPQRRGKRRRRGRDGCRMTARWARVAVAASVCSLAVGSARVASCYALGR